MEIYSVYLPPGAPDSSIGAEVRFLANGKSWLAFLISPLWLLWKRQWLEFCIYMAVLAIIWLLAQNGLGVEAVILFITLQLYLLLEGNEIVRLQHERRGWNHIDMVHGGNMEEAEIRYFGTLSSGREPDAAATGSEAAPDNAQCQQGTQRQQGRSQSIGLFPLDDMALNGKSSV